MGAVLPESGRFPFRLPLPGRTAALVLVLLSLGAGGLAHARAQEPAARDTARATMPDVTGLTLSEARARLRVIGLEVGRIDLAQASAPEGTVVRQWPAVGSPIPAPAAVRARLTLAMAPRRGRAAPSPGTVPDLGGLTLGEARRRLKKAGLATGAVSWVPSRYARGTIVGQGTAPGTEARRGSHVELRVSDAPAPKVQVPDLVGKSVAEATATVAALHLRIARVDSQATTSGVGSILRQHPRAGSEVAESTGITLVRGVAPPPVVAAQSPAARAEPAPARRPPPWRRLALFVLVLGSWAALAALVVVMVRRRRSAAAAETAGGRSQAEWPILLAPGTPPPATTSPARLRVEAGQPSSVSSAPTWGRRPQAPSPAAEADSEAIPPLPGPSSESGSGLTTGGVTGSTALESSALSAIELTTIADAGTAALVLAGPLEAAPTVPLDAAPTMLFVAGGEPTASATAPGASAEGDPRVPRVGAMLAAGRVATDALAALGAHVHPSAEAERGAAGPAGADELGQRILSAILNALEIPLVRVLEEAWRQYDAFREYLDPARCPPDRINVVTLAGHTVHARFRPLVELRSGGRLDTSVRADVGLAITFESGVLWIHDNRFAELRPGRCTVWGGIRCAGVTLLQRPATLLSLPRIVPLGAGSPLSDVVGAGR